MRDLKITPRWYHPLSNGRRFIAFGLVEDQNDLYLAVMDLFTRKTHIVKPLSKEWERSEYMDIEDDKEFALIHNFMTKEGIFDQDLWIDPQGDIRTNDDETFGDLLIPKE